MMSPDTYVCLWSGDVPGCRGRSGEMDLISHPVVEISVIIPSIPQKESFFFLQLKKVFG